MKSKIVFIIGMHIENLDDAGLNTKFHIETFPELSQLKVYGGDRLPRHATFTAQTVRALLLDAKKANSDPLAIVTHSMHAVSVAGELISDGVLPAANVEIWKFDSEAPKGVQPDEKFSFDDQGVLKDWPFGWFEPE